MSSEPATSQPSLAEKLSAAQARIKELEGRLEAGKERFHAAMEAEEMVRSIILQSPAVLFRRVAGPIPQLIYVSDNVSQWGYDAQDFLTEKITFDDLVDSRDKKRVYEEIDQHQDRNINSYQQEYRIRTNDGQMRWVYDRTLVVRGADGQKLYNQGLIVDVTERKLAEVALCQSEAKLRRILETAGEGYAFMSLDLVYQDVNQAYCDMLGYTREELLGKTPMELATPEFAQYMATHFNRLKADTHRIIKGDLVAKDGHVVPVLIHSNTLMDENGRPTNNVAFVTDMSEHNKALVLAGEVQKSLLPQEAPKVEGYDVAGRSVSCEDVGGDYFDFVQGICEHKKNLCITVGDVSGHGIDAALLMTASRAFMRARSREPGSLSEVVGDLNRQLATDLYGTGRFMTLFALAIRLDTGCMAWVRAGHDPALLYSPGTGGFSQLSEGGLPIAVDKDTQYQEHYLTGLQKGEIVAIGTDGIWEAVSSEGEMFGKQRFRRVIQEHAEKSAQEILDAVFSDVERFTRGMKNEDDITLVIVKVSA